MAVYSVKYLSVQHTKIVQCSFQKTKNNNMKKMKKKKKND